VDYGAALEMRFGETRRGFESRPLRQPPAHRLDRIEVMTSRTCQTLHVTHDMDHVLHAMHESSQEPRQAQGPCMRCTG
jgi:hypothetical protein